MDFARQQRDPTRHLIGITFVIVLHALILWAMVPPPPSAPPAPYVPPPDIAPPVVQTAPAITAVTPEPPPKQEYKIEPPPPPPPPKVEAPPPPPPKPAVRRGITPVTREDPVYPRAAIRAGIDKGRVLARVNIDEQGNVTEVIIVSAEPPRHFDSAVREALSKWKFKAEGEKYVGEIEVVFSLKD